MWWKYKISNIIFWFDSNKFYEGSSNFVATFSIKPSDSHQTCKVFNFIYKIVLVQRKDIASMISFYKSQVLRLLDKKCDICLKTDK